MPANDEKLYRAVYPMWINLGNNKKTVAFLFEPIQLQNFNIIPDLQS